MPGLLDAQDRFPDGSAIPRPLLVRVSHPGQRHLHQTTNRPYRFDASCSALRRGAHTTTMASADFCCPIWSPLDVHSTRQNSRSPRVRRVAFVPSIRRIYFQPIRMTIGLRVILPPRPRLAASYAVRVPRIRTLPTASFRLHLAVAALAVQLRVPVITVPEGTCTPPATSRFRFLCRLKAPLLDASRHTWRTNSEIRLRRI